MIYANNIQMRLQYISRLLSSIHTKSQYPISIIHVHCSLHINSKIKQIYKLFDDITNEAKERSPSMIIFHDLDNLISYQKEQSVAAMRSFQIGQRFKAKMEEL